MGGFFVFLLAARQAGHDAQGVFLFWIPRSATYRHPPVRSDPAARW